MATRVSINTIINSDTADKAAATVIPSNNSTIQVNDSSLQNQLDKSQTSSVTNNSDVISVNDPAFQKSDGIKYKLPDAQSIYSTEITDSTNQKIIQITNGAILNPAGNIGAVQYNNYGEFGGSNNLSWDINNKLLLVDGNVNVSNVTVTNIEANSNIAFNIGSPGAYKFTTDGQFKTPYYSFPYQAGLSGQSLISDGLGGLFWDFVNTPFSRISSITGATGVVVHNVSNGFNFAHTNLAGDFTMNVVGLVGLTNLKTIAITLILLQSNPAYLPTTFQIEGVTIPVIWSDNQTPIGYPNKKQLITYNIFNENSTYQVFGHYSVYEPAV